MAEAEAAAAAESVGASTGGAAASVGAGHVDQLWAQPASLLSGDSGLPVRRESRTFRRRHARCRRHPPPTRRTPGRPDSRPHGATTTTLGLSGRSSRCAPDGPEGALPPSYSGTRANAGGGLTTRRRFGLHSAAARFANANNAFSFANCAVVAVFALRAGARGAYPRGRVRGGRGGARRGDDASTPRRNCRPRAGLYDTAAAAPTGSITTGSALGIGNDQSSIDGAKADDALSVGEMRAAAAALVRNLSLSLVIAHHTLLTGGLEDIRRRRRRREWRRRGLSDAPTDCGAIRRAARCSSRDRRIFGEPFALAAAAAADTPPASDAPRGAEDGHLQAAWGRSSAPRQMRRGPCERSWRARMASHSPSRASSSSSKRPFRRPRVAAARAAASRAPMTFPCARRGGSSPGRHPPGPRAAAGRAAGLRGRRRRSARRDSSPRHDGALCAPGVAQAADWRPSRGGTRPNHHQQQGLIQINLADIVAREQDGAGAIAVEASLALSVCALHPEARRHADMPDALHALAAAAGMSGSGSGNGGSNGAAVAYVVAPLASRALVTCGRSPVAHRAAPVVAAASNRMGEQLASLTPAGASLPPSNTTTTTTMTAAAAATMTTPPRCRRGLPTWVPKKAVAGERLRRVRAGERPPRCLPWSSHLPPPSLRRPPRRHPSLPGHLSTSVESAGAASRTTATTTSRNNSSGLLHDPYNGAAYRSGGPEGSSSSSLAASAEESDAAFARQLAAEEERNSGRGRSGSGGGSLRYGLSGYDAQSSTVAADEEMARKLQAEFEMGGASGSVYPDLSSFSSDEPPPPPLTALGGYQPATSASSSSSSSYNPPPPSYQRPPGYGSF